MSAKLFCVLFTLASFSLSAQQNTCEIIGSIRGLKEGEKVTMRLKSEFGFTLEEFDSAIVKKSVFKLKGNVPEGPRMFMIEFSEHPNTFFNIVVSNEKVSIQEDDYKDLPEGNIRSLLTITGSKSDASFFTFFGNFSQYFTRTFFEWNKYISKVEDSLGFDPIFMDGLMQTQKLYKKMIEVQFLSFIKEFPSFQISIPNVVNTLYPFIGKADFLPELYNHLDVKAQNSYYGKRLKQYSLSAIGQYAPDFSCTTIEGIPFRLSNAISGAKLTLLYFWSPSALQNKKAILNELNFIYEKYSDKGFKIIAVSTDTNDDQWKKIVQNEKIPWINVSDLEGASKGVAMKYSYNPGIFPFNILIDQNGKILDWSVQGIMLNYYINKVLNG